VKWQIVLFDLDGTLTESGPGVTNGLIKVFEAFDIPIPTESEIRKYLGPPLSDSFAKFAGLRGADLDRAIQIYRDYYREIGRFENSVFADIPQLLNQLTHAGKQLAVATSKFDQSAQSILEHFELSKHFQVIAGADEHGHLRGTKAKVIAHAITELGVTDLNSAVMIGDREHDIHGANEHQIESIGVLWGYGDAVELSSAGATHIVSNVNELSELLLG